MAFSFPGIARAENTTVSSCADLHIAVIVDRNARHRGKRLPLRACRNAEDMRRRQRFHLGVANHPAGRQPQIAEPLCGVGSLQHPAPHERDLALKLIRQVDENLHPVHARRERRHEQLARGRREHFLERVLDFQLRPREAAAVDVRAVAEQRQHAGAAEFGKSVHVEMLSVDRRLIDLEVARVHDGPGRRVHRQRDAIGHAVRDAQELDLAVADAHALARLHRHQAVARIDSMLFELRPQQRERQRRAVHVAFNQRPYVRNAADVVLVAVRQQQRRRPRLALLQVRQIRYQQIDARQFRTREHDAGIDDERRLIGRHRHRVHAEFAEPAERDHL